MFRAELPEPLPEDSKLMLEMLDDVTGLYFNSSRFEMAQDDVLNYAIRIPLPVSSDMKYRYVRINTSSSYEFTSHQEQVRFRLARINGPEIIDDIITTWVDQPYTGPAGRISGQMLDNETQAPIPNLLISAGGMQALSASDGSFMLDGLVPGVHNLVIYSMDGMYNTFQQGALIAENANTPVHVQLTRRETTEVTFEVSTPFGLNVSQPLRFVSNLLPLGNAYADLSAGSAGSAVNYPAMEKITSSRYSIKLEIPIGFHLRYKYSFGDGFWNAELNNEGNFVVRDLLIEDGLFVKDKIKTFTANGSKPVNLMVQAPPGTPQQEGVFIQFNPFGWMEPLPMVASGENQWQFTIFTPLHFFDSIEYRYCRNGQCDIAAEDFSTVRRFTPLNKQQLIQDTIGSWENLENYTSNTTDFLTLESVPPKPGFIAGIETVPGKPASWRYSIDDGLGFAAGIGGDWVILSPTWTASSNSFSPVIAPSPGTDMLWTELMNLNSHVMMSGQKSIFFPIVNYAQTPETFWSDFSVTDERIIKWNEQYAVFMYHNADLAQILGIEGLVIGDPSILSLSSTINDTNEIQPVAVNWQELIKGIRERYSGRLIGTIILNSNGVIAPDWLDQVDIIYVLFTPDFEDDSASVAELRQEIAALLLNQLEPIFRKYNKPIILGFSSTSGNTAANIDLDIQAKSYSAAILSAASTEWITGFISRGYLPFVELQDASSTIYRKPASEILWFWFHYLLGKPPQ